MAQEKLNGVSDDWKRQTKHISFQNGSNEPSLSGYLLYIYHPTFEGKLDLSQFPNLRRISFANNLDVNNLESIDVSENAEFCKIVLNESSAAYPLRNANCKWLIKERQLSQVVVFYHKLIYANNTSYWAEKYELLKKQKEIPYVLVENGKKLEQLEAEIEKLNQAIAEKDQQIESLKKENEQTPTLSQFHELVDIVFSPNIDLDFDDLKNEIKGLKLKAILPHYQEEKENLMQLISSSKNKAGTNLEKFLDLFLQIQKQIIEENDTFAKGQLSAYQIILQEKLDYEELQTLLNEQKKFLKLEKQLHFLQTQEETFP